MSLILCVAVLMSALPLCLFTATGADSGNFIRVADPSTMGSWKKLFPITGDITTENAGRVWMDKSVFTDASAFGGIISQNDPNSFLVALSAMAANKSVTGTSGRPPRFHTRFGCERKYE
jgi:hypothetical protein